MKHGSSLGRLRVEALALPEGILRALKAHRFRSVGDIMVFGVSDVALLCKLGESGSGLMEAALNAPHASSRSFTERVPFRTAKSFEQKIDFGCSEEFLLLPVTSLRLSSRAGGILKRLGLKTISDILAYGIENFADVDNIGESTRASIENSILDLMDGEMLGHYTPLTRLIDCLLPSDKDKRDTVAARFGLRTGMAMSMQEIGALLGMSQYRVGKIVLREMRKMTLGKAGIALFLLLQRVEIALIRNGYIAAFEDMARYPFFRSRNGLKPIIFMINLLCALFPNRYRVIEGHYLTCLSPSEVAGKTEWLKNIFEVFLHQISVGADSDRFPPSPRYVLHCLCRSHEKKKPEPELNRQIDASVLSAQEPGRLSSNRTRSRGYPTADSSNGQPVPNRKDSGAPGGSGGSKAVPAVRSIEPGP